MLQSHCNRCGRGGTDLFAEAPMSPRSWIEGGNGGEDDQGLQPFFVCSPCSRDAESPYRFCGRCGKETPPDDLMGGQCSWCRAAESIPFDEPADEAWWAGKSPQ